MRKTSAETIAKIVSLRRMGLSYAAIEARTGVASNTCCCICDRAGLERMRVREFYHAVPDGYRLNRGSRWQRECAAITLGLA